MTAPHDVPGADELVRAVREFIERDVMDATEGRVRFHARVADLPDQRDAHASALAQLGVADEAELAAAIRDGTLDERRAEVIEVVRATVSAKLAVAHPGYTDRP